MKRSILLCLAVAVIVTAAVPVWAQRRKDDDERIRFYVLAEIRGFDVKCNKLISLTQVKERATELEREQVETRKTNYIAKKELIALRRKVVALKQLKGRKKSEAEKQEVQARIDEAEKSIEEKKGQINPVVIIRVSKAFRKSEDADALIDRYEREARIARERAQKK